jgi:hypothetical protein
MPRRPALLREECSMLIHVAVAVALPFIRNAFYLGLSYVYQMRAKRQPVDEQ